MLMFITKRALLKHDDNQKNSRPYETGGKLPAFLTTECKLINTYCQIQFGNPTMVTLEKGNNLHISTSTQDESGVNVVIYNIILKKNDENIVYQVNNVHIKKKLNIYKMQRILVLLYFSFC